MPILREDIDAGLVDFSEMAEDGAAPLPPIHPGQILMDEWLAPLAITPYRLAKDIGVPPNRVTEIGRGERAISAETALRLARYFGTDARSWINLQTGYDLQTARRELGERLMSEVKVRSPPPGQPTH